jgi:hypothetical protein
MSTSFQRRTFLPLTLALLCSPAWAQDKYPAKPVTVVVPQAAGGANDAIARIVAQKLSELSGQSFVVENRPGAGGNIGTALVAKARPDGYTLMLTADSSFVINPSLYKSTGFDPLKDFEPVGPVATAGYVLVANNNFPAKNVSELIAQANFPSPARQDHDRLGRQRHGQPPGGRDAQQSGRHQPGACALQGRGSGRALIWWAGKCRSQDYCGVAQTGRAGQCKACRRPSALSAGGRIKVLGVVNEKKLAAQQTVQTGDGA